jgi:RNA 2',3'-cyclic 3'-phosphodiesterase
MLRLFAAVEVPEDIALELAPHQDRLPGARWREPEQLHVTLRFFGETPEPRADDLDAELSTVAAQPFDLTLAGAGAFGLGHQQRAVWAGVEPNAALNRLAARCESAARRAGLAPETRTYKPHVTLAYVRQADPDKVGQWVREHSLLRCSPFRVTWFGLYSSTFGGDGSAYRLEREYPLV